MNNAALNTRAADTGAANAPCNAIPQGGLPAGGSIQNMPQLGEWMRHFVGPSLAEKPRPFKNVAQLWGAGSCYINAALQVLFSSPRVQLTLARTVSRSRLHSALWSFCTTSDVADIRAAQADGPRGWSDTTLAIMFAAAMQGSGSNGQSLLGRPLYPAVFLRECYTGEQEDSASFLMACLERCPATLLHFTGRFHPALLECAACDHRIPAGGHEDEMSFTTLQIESRCQDSGRLYSTVQSALSASFSETLPGDFRERCPLCGQEWSRKLQRVERAPDTLLLQIKRWVPEIMPDGAARLRRLPSAMRMDEVVALESATYNLQGIIYQYGDTPTGGHYVAVARHGNGPEPFFVYNDAYRRGVDRAALACDMNLAGAWRTQLFHATALLYEQSA